MVHWPIVSHDVAKQLEASGMDDNGELVVVHTRIIACRCTYCMLAMDCER